MTGRLIFCCILLLQSVQLASQQEYKSQADYAFSKGHYEKAIRLYKQYGNINRDANALGKRGISYFNYNLVEKAIEDFTAAKKLGNNQPILYLKMGQSKQFLRSFDEAAFFYQKYLELSPEDAPYRKLAELEIKNCVYSGLQSFETSGTLVQSFGDDVNSRYDEIYPIQNPEYGNVFYFSSNRNKTDFDILAYTLSEDGLWAKNDISEEQFNNGYQNVALDIDTGEGNALLTTEVNMLGGSVQFISLDNDGNSIRTTLPEEIFKDAEDITIVNHNVLVFASKQLQGMGGYDLFTVSYKDGEWSTPSNLGSAINTPFDERSPFYSNNLNHLYFSSNRPYCFGGYDIYYCDIKNQRPPVNMGYGINSTGDDLHFNIDDAGHMVTFSSNRKTGLGGFDLYFAYLQDIKNIGTKDSLRFEYLNNPNSSFVQVIRKDLPKENNTEASNTTKEETIVQLDTIDRADDIVEISTPDEVLNDNISAPVSDNISVVEDSKSSEETNLIEKTSPPENIDTVKVQLPSIDTSHHEEKVVESIDNASDSHHANDLSTPENNQMDNQINENKTVEANPEDTSNEIKKEDKSNEATQENTVDDELKSSTPIDLGVIDEGPQNKGVVDVELEKTKEKQPSIDKAQKPTDQISSLENKKDVDEINTSKKFDKKPDSWRTFVQPKTLYYEDRQDLTRGENMTKLNQLIIEEYDTPHQIVLLVHTDHLELGLPEYTQYNTFKRARQVAKYLVDNGIDKSRIRIESVANNFPLIKEDISGEKISSLLAHNKRVDILIYEDNNLIQEDNVAQDGSIPSYAFDKRYELFRSVREGRYYSVEIASADRIFKNAILRLYNDIYIRRDNFDGPNHYFIGVYTQKEDAINLKKELDETSTPYAKVVEFVNGVRVE